MCRAGQPVDEVIRRPGSGELHLAVFHQLAGAGVLVLVALDALVFDEVGDIEQHLAGFRAPAGNFLSEGQNMRCIWTVDGAGPGLALALPGAAFSRRLVEVFLADRSHADGAGNGNLIAAAVVDHDLEVHLGLSTEAVDVGEELALIGTDRAAEGVIIRKNGAEAEGKNGGGLETICDHAGVVDSDF